VRIRRPHVLHGFVVLVVLVQLAFAAAFLVDAAETNTASDALAHHRVAVHGHPVACSAVATGAFRTIRAVLCRVDYTYAGVSYTGEIPKGWPTTFYVDPADPAHRMSEVDFEKGPTETVGDLVIASLLVLGALAVTVVHLEHLRARRHARTPTTE
jgi:hypothetical protein